MVQYYEAALDIVDPQGSGWTLLPSTVFNARFSCNSGHSTIHLGTKAAVILVAGWSGIQILLRLKCSEMVALQQ